MSSSAFRIVAAFVLLLLATPPVSAEVVRNIDESFSAVGVEAVRIDVPVGELWVRGSDGQQVKISVEVECSAWRSGSCREKAEQLELRQRVSGDRMKIALVGFPRSKGGMSVSLQLEIPRGASLEADMGVGEVDLSDLEGDISLDLGVGEVVMELPEEAVGSVLLDVGIGEVELSVGSRRLEGSGFLSSDLDWRDGVGDARVEVECGVGEVEVRLR